jgi:hypothetical protein
VHPSAERSVDTADMCQGGNPSAHSGPSIDTVQQVDVPDDSLSNLLPTSSSSIAAGQRRHSSAAPAGSNRPEGTAHTSPSGVRSSSADIDRRQGLLDTAAPTTCSSTSSGSGGGSARPPARAPPPPSAPLLPQWYKGPYAALMNTERHVVLYVPSAFAAAGAP